MCAPQIVVVPAATPVPTAQYAPPAVGLSCPANVEGIGAPLSGFERLRSDGEIARVAVDPTGCTIAAWTDDVVAVSWDGGQTFARYLAHGEIHRIAATAGRIMVLRDGDTLGVAHAGDPQITWRALIRLEQGDEQGSPQLVAAGAWTAMFETGAQLLGVSTDDGATWRYVDAPHDIELDAGRDGTLFVQDGAQGYVVDFAHWALRKVGPRRDSPAWSYEITPEVHYGGPHEIVAHHGKRQTTVADKLTTERHAIEVINDRRGAYAVYNQHLYQLRGTLAVDLGKAMFDHVGAIDGYGTLIGHDDTTVWRWSPRSGWRALWHTGEPLIRDLVERRRD